MPRIKPARTIEEINAVPQDKSVTIALEPEETVILDKEADAAEQQALEKKEETQKPAPKSGAPVERGEEEDSASDLKKQLEDLRRANEESKKQVQYEIQARQAAEQRVREREQEAKQSQVRAEDAEYDAILNAIGAAESEAETAQRDIASASEASDSKAVAEASRKLARAESRLAQLEDGKAAIERAKTAQAAQAKNAPQQTEQPRQNPTVEQYIDQLPNLLPSQRDWLKEHPDAISDADINLMLQGAHAEAVKRMNLKPGTQKYFTFLEQRLGYAETPEEDGMEDQGDQSQSPPVSAPPSRSATNPGTGRQTGTRITLTPEQREVARLSGIDEITYAKNLQKLNQLKADGHYGN